jgi:transmembrane protein EpsG
MEIGDYMFYLTFFIVIIAYLSVIDINNSTTKSFFIKSIPVFLLLVVVYGFQFQVGHDYSSYVQFASGQKNIAYFTNNNEFLFVGLIYISRYLGSPQYLFILSAIIQTVFLILISFETKKLGLNVIYYYFLHFAYGLLFYNQFSGLRQYIAIYIVAYAVLLVVGKKIVLPLLLVFFAALFHVSALFFIPLIFIVRFLSFTLSNKAYILIFIGILLLSFLDLQEYFRSLIEIIPRYGFYANRINFGRTSLINILTKIPKLLIVIYAICIVNKSHKSSSTLKLNNLAFISSLVLVASFNANTFFRLYQYFDIFTYYPVLLFLNLKEKRVPKTLIIYGLVVILLVKIILLPEGEYHYFSILFRN